MKEYLQKHVRKMLTILSAGMMIEYVIDSINNTTLIDDSNSNSNDSIHCYPYFYSIWRRFFNLTTELPQVTTNLIKKQTNKQSVFYAWALAGNKSLVSNINVLMMAQLENSNEAFHFYSDDNRLPYLVVAWIYHSLRRCSLVWFLGWEYRGMYCFSEVLLSAVEAQ